MTPTQQWAAHMKFTGAAQTTIAVRTRLLRRVERDVGDPLTLTRADLITFLSVLEHPATRSTTLSYLRAFYAWAVDEGLLEESPAAKVPSIKVPAGQPRPADEDDVRRLLASASPRTRSMALLMVYGGLRCCEVARFRREHLSHDAGRGWWLEIPHSKGGHQQTVPFPAPAAAEVLAGPSWAVSPQTVQRDVSKALKAVGSEATPHRLRHYYGTSALHSTGGNLRKVQEMMRHASPATTARYTKVTASELTDAAEALPWIA